jgi:hypothetical protein
MPVDPAATGQCDHGSVSSGVEEAVHHHQQLEER